MAEGHQRKSYLPLSIDIQQAVHGSVHKSARYLGWQAEGCGDGDEVGEQRAVVPAEVAIGAFLIFPGIAPVGTRADHGQRRVSDGRFVCRGFDQNLAMVSGAELA